MCMQARHSDCGVADFYQGREEEGAPTCARSSPSLMVTPCCEMTARREPSSDQVRLLAGKLRLNIPFQSAEMTAKESAGVGKQQIAECIWNRKTACLVSPFRGDMLPGVSLV